MPSLNHSVPQKSEEINKILDNAYNLPILPETGQTRGWFFTMHALRSLVLLPNKANRVDRNLTSAIVLHRLRNVEVHSQDF